MNKTKLLLLGLLAACGATQKASTATPPPPKPVAENPPQTPSERLSTHREPLPVFVSDGSLRMGTRFVARLDEAVGPQFSSEGKLVTATVVPVKQEDGTTLFPEGTKVRLRVGRIQAAMSGTLGAVTLVPRTMEYNGAFVLIDGRIVGVQLTESASGRTVSASGSDMSGAIVKTGNLTPADLDRDVLGKGTVISVGAKTPDSQLDKGTAISLELYGPIPLALWDGKPGEVDTGWLKDLYAILQTKDGLDHIGKHVEIHGQTVESVIGDTVFWVGPSKDRRVLVVMDQYLDAPETKTIVLAGQHVSLVGIVQAMPSRDLAPYLWRLVSAKEAAEFTPHPAYLYATRVTIDQPSPAQDKVKPAKKKAPRATTMR